MAGGVLELVTCHPFWTLFIIAVVLFVVYQRLPRAQKRRVSSYRKKFERLDVSPLHVGKLSLSEDIVM